MYVLLPQIIQCFMYFCSNVNADWEHSMNTVDTLIYDVHVADVNYTFGFIIELFDGISSKNCLCRVFYPILAYEILFFQAKMELYILLQ